MQSGDLRLTEAQAHIGFGVFPHDVAVGKAVWIGDVQCVDGFAACAQAADQYGFPAVR